MNVRVNLGGFRKRNWWWLYKIFNIIYPLLLAKKNWFFKNIYSLLFKKAARLKLISWEEYVCTCSLLYSSPRIQFSIHVSHSIWGKRDGGCVVQGRREWVLLPNQLSTHSSVPGVCDPPATVPCVCVSFHPRGNWGVPQRNASWATHQAPATDYSIVASRYRCS